MRVRGCVHVIARQCARGGTLCQRMRLVHGPPIASMYGLEVVVGMAVVVHQQQLHAGSKAACVFAGLMGPGGGRGSADLSASHLLHRVCVRHCAASSVQCDPWGLALALRLVVCVRYPRPGAQLLAGESGGLVHMLRVLAWGFTATGCCAVRPGLWHVGGATADMTCTGCSRVRPSAACTCRCQGGGRL